MADTQPNQNYSGQAGAPPYGAPRQLVNPPAIMGPYTLRETILIFLPVLYIGLSFIPIASTPVGSGTIWIFFTANFFLGVILMLPYFFFPLTIAVVILLRRQITGKMRFGSLSSDQFNSILTVVTVVMSFSYWMVILAIKGSMDALYLIGMGTGINQVFPMLAFFISVVTLFLTTFSNKIPLFAGEYAFRDNVEAHPMARPVGPAPAKAPSATQNWQNTQNAGGASAGSFPGAATPPAPPAPPAPPVAPAAPPAPPAPPKAFTKYWVAVPTSRAVYSLTDESVAFTAEPGVWILAVDEHPEGLVLRDAQGVEGVLKEVSDLQRA